MHVLDFMKKTWAGLPICPYVAEDEESFVDGEKQLNEEYIMLNVKTAGRYSFSNAAKQFA